MDLWTDKQKNTLLRKMKHERLCKHIQKASKFEFDDPKDKNFWRKSIDELEIQSRKVNAIFIYFILRLFFQSAKCSRIRMVDLSTSLPEELRNRVEKIIPVTEIEKDEAEVEADEYIDDRYAIVKKSLDDVS